MKSHLISHLRTALFVHWTVWEMEIQLHYALGAERLITGVPRSRREDHTHLVFEVDEVHHLATINNKKANHWTIFASTFTELCRDYSNHLVEQNCSKRVRGPKIVRLLFPIHVSMIWEGVTGLLKCS